MVPKLDISGSLCQVFDLNLHVRRHIEFLFAFDVRRTQPYPVIMRIKIEFSGASQLRPWGQG